MPGNQIQRLQRGRRRRHNPRRRQILPCPHQRSAHRHRHRIQQWLRRRQFLTAHRHLQFHQSLFLTRHHRNHRHPEPLRQPLHIKPQPVALRHIDHVQHQNHRHPKLQNLREQIKIPLRIRSIHHTHNPVRPRRIRPPSQQHIPQNRLVRRPRIQTVRPRQINHPQTNPVLRIELALFPLNRHPGIIPHLLPQSRQRIEQGRLPAIGIPHQRIHQPFAVTRRLHFTPALSVSTSIRLASASRNDSSAPRTPISTGSPIGARRINSTRVPGSNPISRSRVKLGAPSGKVTITPVSPGSSVDNGQRRRFIMLLPSRHRCHQHRRRHPSTQANPRILHLRQHRRTRTHKPHLRLFMKPHLPQSPAILHSPLQMPHHHPLPTPRFRKRLADAAVLMAGRVVCHWIPRFRSHLRTRLSRSLAEETSAATQKFHPRRSPRPCAPLPNPRSIPSDPPPPQVHFDFPISGGYRPEN